jgi:hypothetical protein
VELFANFMTVIDGLLAIGSAPALPGVCDAL